MNRDEQIKKNQELIRALNPDAKVQYPVEYALLDNNAVFVAARIINSMGFDFLNYEDIFKQDFLAAAGYVDHYEVGDNGYWKRGFLEYSKKPFFRMTDKITLDKTTFDEAIKYNEDVIFGLYPVIWKYCSDNISGHIDACTNVDQAVLNKIYNTENLDWLYKKITCMQQHLIKNFPFPIIIGYDENMQLSEEAIKYFREKDETEYETVYRVVNSCAKRILYNYELYGEFYASLDKDNLYLFESSYKYVCSLFEQLTISLVKDCCNLINQIKNNPVVENAVEPSFKPSNQNVKRIRTEHNQKFIRLLNPGAIVEYPVEYPSLDNNSLFVVARVINSLGFNFFNYEDVFKQDFLAAAGYVDHYEVGDNDYRYRSSHTHGNKVITKLKRGLNDTAYASVSFKEAADYNADMVAALRQVLWSYCNKCIMSHISNWPQVNQDMLQNIYDSNYRLNLMEAFKEGAASSKSFSINTPIVVGISNTETNPKKIAAAKKIKPSNFTLEELTLFEQDYQYVCDLFERLTTVLIKDCCSLINQIQNNPAVGEDNPKADITQDAINEMAATVEPELLNGLSAEQIMPSLQKNPYAQVETEYTDVEIDIVRYIMQDMIDAVKAV